MPTPDQILAELNRITNDWTSLAAAWHVYYAAIALMILARTYPSRTFMGVMLALPLLSVSILAWLYGNPFNGTSFTLAAAALVIIAARLHRQTVRIARHWMVIIGAFLFSFGWFYPHFLKASSFWTYLYAAPTGLIPCPTLSASTGLALVLNGLCSRAWMLILGMVGLFYGIFGVVRLGVQIDSLLLVGATAMIIAAFRFKPD